MARLEEQFEIKEKILRAILSDTFLMRALVNPGLSALSTAVDDPTEYSYKNIYPYKRSLRLLDTEENLITMKFSSSGTVESYYKNFNVVFYIVVHNNLDRIVYDGKTVLRSDFILHRLDTIFNKQKLFGIGPIGFKGYNEIEDLPENYHGTGIIYGTVDFN